MGRYSSDSDSRHSSRRKYKSRRSHSRSSSSCSDDYRGRKSKKSKHSSSKVKSSRSSIRSKRYKRSSSRSLSRERGKTKSSSRNDSRSHSRSYSKKHHSRSSSRERYKSRRSDRRRSSDSSTSSSSSNSKTKSKRKDKDSSPEVLREKLLKAMKAGETIDHQLKAEGVLSQDVKSRNEMVVETVMPDKDVIMDINADSFHQKSFTSSKLSKQLEKEEILAATVPTGSASIFHPSLFVDPKVKLMKWVKKLHQIRQRALNGELMDTQSTR